jgi:hypothetical protein
MSPGLLPFRTDLKLWILEWVGRTPWMGNEPVARPLSTQVNTNIKNRSRIQHGSTGTLNPSGRAKRDTSCLTLRNHCDQHRSWPISRNSYDKAIN